jgi:PPOX class probable F420-dependent enzyme
MRRDLPPAELQRFLDEPLVATLATYRKDGSVLLTPVWHEWTDRGFNMMVGPDDVKARNLRRDPRASVTVYQNAPPYAGIELRTTVRFVEEADAHDLDRRMAIRYLGEAAGNAYADSIAGDPMLFIRLEPGEIRSWDYSDIPGLS